MEHETHAPTTNEQGPRGLEALKPNEVVRVHRALSAALSADTENHLDQPEQQSASAHYDEFLADIETLPDRNGEHASETYRALAESDHPDDRRLAANALDSLAAVNAELALALVSQLLDDEDQNVHAAAWECLLERLSELDVFSFKDVADIIRRNA